MAFAANDWNSDAAKQKFDGFLVLTVCAQSTSKPADLVKNGDLHSTNVEKIKAYLADKRSVYVLLSSGDFINDTKKPWLKDNLKDITAVLDTHGAKYFHSGSLTNKGNPRHIRPKKFENLPMQVA